MRHLGNLPHHLDAGAILAETGMHGSSLHLVHVSRLVVGRTFPLDPGAVTPVTGVGGHHGTIGRCFSAHHNGSTALPVKLLGQKGEGYGQGGQGE